MLVVLFLLLSFQLHLPSKYEIHVSIFVEEVDPSNPTQEFLFSTHATSAPTPFPMVRLNTSYHATWAEFVPCDPAMVRLYTSCKTQHKQRMNPSKFWLELNTKNVRTDCHNLIWFDTACRMIDPTHSQSKSKIVVSLRQKTDFNQQLQLTNKISINQSTMSNTSVTNRHTCSNTYVANGNVSDSVLSTPLTKYPCPVATTAYVAVLWNQSTKRLFKLGAWLRQSLWLAQWQQQPVNGCALKILQGSITPTHLSEKWHIELDDKIYPAPKMDKHTPNAKDN